jgi:hypothetical protein
MRADMTKRHDLKAIIRARMEKTGESYSAARRHIEHEPLVAPAPIITPRRLPATGIKGWILGGDAPDRYEVRLDPARRRENASSARISLRAGEANDSSAMLMQYFLAYEYHGRRVWLSAFIATEDVDGSCGLWMRLDSNTQAFLYYKSSHVKGTSDFVQRDVVLDVDEEMTLVSFGITLTGGGTAWLADAHLEVVGDEVQPSASRSPARHPQNLGFAE